MALNIYKLHPIYILVNILNMFGAQAIHNFHCVVFTKYKMHSKHLILMNKCRQRIIIISLEKIKNLFSIF